MANGNPYDDLIKLMQAQKFTMPTMHHMSSTSSSPPVITMQEEVYAVGDKVKYISGRYGDSPANPIWGGVCGEIGGVITSIDGGGECCVTWENGHSNSAYVIGRDVIKLEMTKKKTPTEVIFKIKELDALVVAQEVREEIVAVLKQHKNVKKLFETWGLGKTIEYGRGMTFLFYGSPGTGKTWGATCIGKVVGKELLTIGSAEIQTSEPGGANRNIQKAFETARKEGKVLFIDECDSLITSRADVGMILGSEINTLLTEIEKYEGIVVLATNRIENLDEALERRISLIVEFPEPNHEQRKEIWERLIPKKMPLDKEVTMEKLAEHKLTGGQIKNVVLQAARLALSSDAKKVEMGHFDSAISRIKKSKSLMGSASRYHQEIVKDVTKRRDMDKS